MLRAVVCNSPLTARSWTLLIVAILTIATPPPTLTAAGPSAPLLTTAAQIRDLRLESITAGRAVVLAGTVTAVDAAEKGDSFAHELAAPSEGNAAFLGELVFAEGTDDEFSLSTNVRIVPSRADASEAAIGK